MIQKLLITMLFLALNACSAPEIKEQAEKNPENGIDSPTKDFFTEKVSIRYARNFSVTYHGNYKVVRARATLSEWGSNSDEKQEVEDVMVLLQRGTSAPALTGELLGATVITIPATKIATNNAGSEVWLETLGLEQQQVAVGGLKTYNDATRLAAENGQIGQIGYFWSEPPNMEVVLQRQPDILLATTSQMSVNQAVEKLRSLDIPTAPIFDWAEQDYLGRAEWIKYIALFFNEEAQANTQFEAIEQRVKELKNLASTARNRPSVIWGHFVDSGFWLGFANNAEANLLKAAGVTNPIEDFTLPFSPIGEAFTSEQWLQIGQQVEHWIISTGTTTIRLPNESYLEGFLAWRAGNLYHHYKRSKPAYDVYDWYNSGVVRPDWILADLIALFHPELLPNHQFVFFGKYEKETS